ncbi:MAG: PIN domain-containing protein [Candidatus Binataceae bacterium]
MRHFFDTNVLVYLFDTSAPRKKARAQELLKRAVTDRQALLNTQVLQEFFVAVTRKLSVPLAHELALRATQDLAELPTQQVDTVIILKAIESMRRYRLSFWDSLIVQAALHGGATILYTEDLQNGQRFETLSVQNPFQT